MADRNVAATNTLNYFRHEFNGTASDIGEIQSILDASSYIASSTDVVEAIVALNPELPEITTDAFVFPVGTMVWEGATDDAYETTLSFTDPTADRTYTLPDGGGGVSLLDNAETLTNKTLTNPTINGGTFSGTFTGTMNMTAVLSGASPLVFEGATADAYETTWSFTDPTADRTITVPNATDTLIGKATTDTLSNKSYDLGGTGNTLTGSLSEFNSALQGDSFGTLADTQTWTNKTFTTPTATSPVLNTAVSGSAFLDEDNMASNSATKLASQQSIKAYVDSQTTAQDLDFQGDSGGSLAIDLDSESLTLGGGTGITTTGANNTITMAIDSTVATLAGSQTWANKTFTSATLDTLTFSSGTATSGMQVGGTGVVFEGSTADAYETTLTAAEPTQDNTITIPNQDMTLLTTATHASKFSHIVKCIALG
jgi:hypothetical protein